MTTKEFKKKHGKLGNCTSTTLDIIAYYQSRYKKDREKIPEEMRFMLGRFGDLRLANGLVFNPVTEWHLHAWLEDDMWCYDFSNGNKAILPKARYYHLGECKDVKLYSREAAIKKATETGICGFWDFDKNIN